MDALFRDLTPPQQEAVRHVDGPLLILAGPGSGKTRVVTHRIANLLAQGIPESQIAALTFTNKAADEMRQRVDRFDSGETCLDGDLPPFLRSNVAALCLDDWASGKLFDLRHFGFQASPQTRYRSRPRIHHTRNARPNRFVDQPRKKSVDDSGCDANAALVSQRNDCCESLSRLSETIVDCQRRRL